MTTLQPLDIWTDAIAPMLPTAGLAALARALRYGSRELIEEETAQPFGGCDFRPQPTCVGACAIAFPLWKGHGLQTSPEVEDAFDKVTEQVNQKFRSGEFVHLPERPVNVFLFFWDDPQINRKKKRQQLYKAVRKELEKRKESNEA